MTSAGPGWGGGGAGGVLSVCLILLFLSTATAVYNVGSMPDQTIIQWRYHRSTRGCFSRCQLVHKSVLNWVLITFKTHIKSRKNPLPLVNCHWATRQRIGWNVTAHRQWNTDARYMLADAAVQHLSTRCHHILSAKSIWKHQRSFMGSSLFYNVDVPRTRVQSS